MVKDNVPIKILVIEDNLGDYLLIKDYLEELIETLQIEHCTKYSDAKIILSSTEKRFDVVLLDLTLPDNRGETLITDIVSQCPDIPVIVITGYGDVEFGVKSLTLKVSDYLIKDDINASSLYKSIKYNIERKRTNILLEESEKKYMNLFELSPQSMWIYNITSLYFLQVNKAATALYGYSLEEFNSLKLTDIFSDIYTSEEKIKIIESLNQNKEIYKGRYKHEKKSKELIDVDMYTNKIIIDDSEYETMILIDVTESIITEKKITSAIIKTQEEERFEIGSELHDNVCQILASGQLSLEMLKEKIPDDAIQWYEKSKKFINLALDEIRNISHRLAPSFFDHTTIQDNFKELINIFNSEEKYEINLHFNYDENENVLNSDVQLNLYRILQEQLSNISKYSKASNVYIELTIKEKNLTMIIEDNGIGFNSDEIKKGIGLANIKRRTELLSGKMNLKTSLGKGCTLIITIPIL
jgi:PAS domain S-box-containing protein